MTEKLKKGGQLNKYMSLIEGIREMNDSVKKSEQGSTHQFWKLIGKTLVMQNFDALRDFHWNALFIGTMHFMDRYNYDISRVQRCCIHYATPDGKLIPVLHVQQRTGLPGEGVEQPQENNHFPGRTRSLFFAGILSV